MTEFNFVTVFMWPKKKIVVVNIKIPKSFSFLTFEDTLQISKLNFFI